MNLSKSHIIALALLLPIFSSCSVSAFDFFKEKNVIWQGSTNEFFKYAAQDTSDFGENDHPVELSGKDISTILGLIKIQAQDNHKEKKELEPLFSAEQVTLLGQYLAKGLNNAQADQDIIFALEKSVDSFIGLKPDRFFVAGRAFYKNNKLNIIIGDYDLPRHNAYEAAYDPTHTGIVRYHFNYGKRSQASKFNKPITRINGVENKRLANDRRDDWLLIDVNTALKAYERMTGIRKKKELEKKREELREVLGGDQIAPLEETAPVKAKRSLEERLIELKRLRNKDLITEEEYAEKRKQLLDEL